MPTLKRPTEEPVALQRRTIRANAARAFAEHALVTELDQGLHRSYWCQKPGTGFYSFRVVTWPGWVAVAGDIGFTAVSRCPDMLEFARQAIDSPDYFASKTAREIEARKYLPECGEWWLWQGVDEAEHLTPRTRQRARQALLRNALRDEIYSDRHTFCAELLERGIIHDCDFPRCEGYDPSFLWCLEALRWLLARLPAECRVADNG